MGSKPKARKLLAASIGVAAVSVIACNDDHTYDFVGMGQYYPTHPYDGSSPPPPPPNDASIPDADASDADATDEAEAEAGADAAIDVGDERSHLIDD